MGGQGAMGFDADPMVTWLLRYGGNGFSEGCGDHDCRRILISFSYFAAMTQERSFKNDKERFARGRYDT